MNPYNAASDSPLNGSDSASASRSGSGISSEVDVIPIGIESSQQDDIYSDMQIDVDSSSDPDSGYHDQDGSSADSIEEKYDHGGDGELPDLTGSESDTDTSDSSGECGPPPRPDDQDVAWVGSMCRDLVVWKMIDGGLTYKGALKIVDLVRKWSGPELTRTRRKMLPRTWAQLMRRATTDSNMEKTTTVVVLSCPRRHQVVGLVVEILVTYTCPQIKRFGSTKGKKPPSTKVALPMEETRSKSTNVQERRVKIYPKHGHHLFEDGAEDGTECPVCGWALVRRKAERLHMWPVGARLRNMMQQPILRKAMRAQFDRKQNPLKTIASVYEVSLGI
jgi:hypothetical protein